MSTPSLFLGLTGITAEFSGVAALLGCDTCTMCSLTSLFLLIIGIIIAGVVFWLDLKIVE